MFKVKSLGQNNPNNIPIMNGITFGYIGMPLFFEVEADGIESKLIIELNVLQDKDRKTNEFVSPNNIENNTVRYYYYNPSIGTSGLTQPIGIQVKTDVFGFVFYIDYLKDSVTYRLSYEFYHGKL